MLLSMIPCTRWMIFEDPAENFSSKAFFFAQCTRMIREDKFFFPEKLVFPRNDPVDT